MTTTNQGDNSRASGGSKQAARYTQQQAAAAKRKRQVKQALDKKMKDAISKNPNALAKVKADMRLKAQIAANIKAGKNPNGTPKGSPSGTGTRPTPPTLPTQPDPKQLLAVRSLMADYGMSDLWDYVEHNLVTKEGYGAADADAIWIRLKTDTDKLPNGKTVADTYKARFPANEARVKNGYAEMTPTEYVTYERKVQSMIGLALPGYKGFYDKPSDYTNLIANNVDPEDLQSRINMAHEAAINADPGLVKSLQDMYGVGQSDLVAYFLDPTKTEQIVRQRYNAAQFNAAARKAGAQFSTQFAEEVAATQGGEPPATVAGSDDKALAGIADELSAARSLSGMYSQDAISDEDVARSAMNMQGASDIDQRRKRLASRERAAFSGKLSADSGTLSERKNI